MTAPGGRAQVVGQAIINIIPDVKNFARRLRQELRVASRDLRQLDREVRQVSTTMRFLARNATGIAPGIKLATAAFRALGAEAIVGGILALGGAALELSGAAGILPAVFAAAGSAAATFSIGMIGVEDALKKFEDPAKYAEELEKLSTNARSAFQVFEDFRPVLNLFKNSIQDALFVGLDQTFTDLIETVLPVAQEHFTSLARVFNNAGRELARFVQSGETLRDLRGIGDNIERGFRNLRPAIVPAATAIRDLVAVGSTFLPQIAREVAIITQRFATFISTARQTGQLREWMASGLEVLKQLGRIALNVGRTLFAVFN